MFYYLIRFLLFSVWLMVFLVNMIIYVIDLLVAKILKIKARSPYLLKGQCRQSGMCCQAIGLEIRYQFLRNSFFIKILKFFYHYIYQFSYLGMNHQTMVFSCRYLENNRCSIYPFRPKLCREYPMIGLFDHSKVRRGCGYWFIKKEDQNNFDTKLKEKQQNQNQIKYRFEA